MSLDYKMLYLISMEVSVDVKSDADMTKHWPIHVHGVTIKIGASVYLSNNVFLFTRSNNSSIIIVVH